MERPLENIWFVSFLESNMKKLLQSPNLKCKGICLNAGLGSISRRTLSLHLIIFCAYTYILLYIHVYKNLHFCQQTKIFFQNMVEVSGEEWSSETNGAQFKWWSETIQVLPWDKCLKLPTYLPPLMYSILVLQPARKERRIDVFSSWAASHNRCSYFLVSLVRSGTASPIYKFIKMNLWRQIDRLRGIAWNSVIFNIHGPELHWYYRRDTEWLMWHWCWTEW